MKYDFTTVLSRKDTGSGKWNDMYAANPEVPEGTVPFSVADMELLNPPQIAEGIGEYLKTHIMGYTYATDAYYDAVAGWMKRRHNWEIEKDWIIEYPGVVPALYHAVLNFTDPGDGVILFTPIYYPFYTVVQAGGRTIVESRLVQEGTHYQIDYDDFERKASDPRNKLLLLCSPHNPVGRVWSREELDRIGRICMDHDVLMVADEIHHDLIMPGYTHTVLATVSDEMAQHCIVCTAPSKTFNLAGMMVSNVIVPNPELRKRVMNFRLGQGIFYCNIAGYKACEIAYNECEDWLDELIGVLDTNRRLVERFMAEKMPQIQVIPLEGTYLQWLDCRSLGLSRSELEHFMTHEAFVFSDEGYVFGETGEGFERINLACPTRVLEDALERMYDAWQRRGA